MEFESISKALDPNLLKRDFTICPDRFLIGTVQDVDDVYKIHLYANWNNLVLHWGLGYDKQNCWVSGFNKPGILIPENSTNFDDKAVQSAFTSHSDNFASIQIIIEKQHAPRQINFVIKRDENWHNN